MLPLLSKSLLSLLIFSLAALADDQTTKPDFVSIQTASPNAPTTGDFEVAPSTTFNGVEVPPMRDINGEEFDKEIKDGYW